MESILVSFERALLCCFEIADIARIFYTHMYSQLMLIVTALSSCLVFTFPALVLFPIVDGLLVPNEASFCSCLVFTFPTLVLFTFMDGLLVFSEITLCG